MRREAITNYAELYIRQKIFKLKERVEAKDTICTIHIDFHRTVLYRGVLLHLSPHLIAQKRSDVLDRQQDD